MYFYVKKVLTGVALPPTSCLLITVAGLYLLARGKRRSGFTLAWLGVLLLLALSMPIVAAGLTFLVYDGSLLDERELRDVSAIVVLGGGLRHNAPEYGGDAPALFTLERLRYGATLARQTGLPVLVTGGRLHSKNAEAEVMREVLEHEFSVPVKWIEPHSRNTHENAVFSARVLHAHGISRVVLVTHGIDARRARREFTAAGLRVTVAPTVIPELSLEGPLDFLPSADALGASSWALYELLANLAATLGLNRY